MPLLILARQNRLTALRRIAAYKGRTAQFRRPDAAAFFQTRRAV